MSTSTDSTLFKQLREAAEQGDVHAQRDLGNELLASGSTSDEVDEGISWIRKAAERNELYAQLLLGAIYAGLPCRWTGTAYRPGSGSLVPDHQEALKWFRRAADQGSSDGQLTLGQLYERGTTTTPADLGEAVKWYTIAANNHESRAAYALASMYFGDSGVTQDYAEAAKWYRKLADGWSSPAQARLGWMHENGKGVTHDIVEAHKWFNLAVENLPMTVAVDDEVLEKTREEAERGRARVEQAMTPAQIKDAWQRYDDWKNALRAKTGA